MKPIAGIFLVAVYVLALHACAPGGISSGDIQKPGPSLPSSGDTFRITGTVVHVNLEGGFYAIRGDDGRTYNPSNLPESFRKDGLSVTAVARTQTDAMSIHMVGPIIEIVNISAR